MKKLFLLSCAISLLSGCGFFQTHKLDVIQGNVFTQSDVKKLHQGMPASQVMEILGKPVLINVFTRNQLEYVYTYQPGYGKKTEKHLSLTFRNGILTEMHYVAN